MSFLNLLFSFSLFASIGFGWQNRSIAPSSFISFQDEVISTTNKDKALKVLKQKCNTCHQLQNKSVVFSKDNMNSRAKAIHKQVFVKRRMPKSGVTLSIQEEKDLKTWVDEVLGK